jgi:PAS domain-containing protein
MNDSTTDGIGGQSDQLGQLKSAVLEATPNAVAITNREGIIVWVNPAFRQLTGYNIGTRLGTILSPDNPVAVLKAVALPQLENKLGCSGPARFIGKFSARGQ